MGLMPAGAGFGGSNQRMAKSDEPITIKKYANRRLYNTGTSTYVTLEDLATMVKAGEDFVVYDAKTNEDITRSVLTQIIFEQENKEGGQNLLPINFLRQLIRFYGDSMQMMVPRYLEVSINSLTSEQAKFREQISHGVRHGRLRRDRGAGAPEHGDVRAHLLDVRAVRASGSGRRGRRRAGQGAEAGREPATAGGGDIDDLKRQIDEMQKRIDRIGDKDKTVCYRRIPGRRGNQVRASALAPRSGRSPARRPTAARSTRARSARPADSRSPSPQAARAEASSCTHSATVLSPSRLARSTSADTKARSSSVRIRFCTKAPSILRISTPSLRRLRNDV